MNIFFEGPNGSGKSTIADLVKNALRWDQLNLHHRRGDQFIRYLAEYSRTNTVFVRAHWSEQVYSDIYGRANPFTLAESMSLDGVARLRGIVVLCLPYSIDTLKQRYAQRQTIGLDTDRQAKLELIDREYQLWNASLGCSADLVYRSDGQEDLRKSTEEIVRMVRAREPDRW